MPTLYTFRLGPGHTGKDSCNEYDGKMASSMTGLPAFPPLHAGCTCFIEREDVKIGEPFAGYADFADCVSKNQDKNDPEAYCGTIKAQTGEQMKRCSICGQYMQGDMFQQHVTKYHPGQESKEIKAENAKKPSALGRLEELGLVHFQMDSRLAVPTISGNKRKWTEKELKGAIPHYIGKPVMLDHSSNVGDVVAVTTDCFWGPSKARPEDTMQALRAHSIGVMDKGLFEKLRTDGKNVIGVPLVKGLSIGGMADIEYDEAGNEIPVNFIPDEYSITPFPGIKEAEIERMVPIIESLRKKKEGQIRQKITESDLPEFIPLFLLPLRGEACPEGYTLDQYGKTCEIAQQMAKLPPLVQDHLRKGAPGYTLIENAKKSPLIYVKNEWIVQASKHVDETGSPSQEWWDSCVKAITGTGTANPEGVASNVWFAVVGERIKQTTAKPEPQKFDLPKETKDMLAKLTEKKQVEVPLPHNLFTQTFDNMASEEEKESFRAMIMDIERSKRGLPPLEASEENAMPSGPKTEAKEQQKIIESLTQERDRLKERAEKIDALKMEKEQLQRKLEQERGLYKQLEEGRRIPFSPGKGKTFTQTGGSIDTEKIESLEDSAELYKHFLGQGMSRKDATQAVMLKVLEQADLA